MIKPKNIQVYYKLFMFLKILYKAVENMPKAHKYNLGQELVDLTWSCLDKILLANSQDRFKKREQLESLSVEFDRLKARIRMLKELKIISLAQYSHWQENHIVPTGSMIGGWLKWSR